MERGSHFKRWGAVYIMLVLFFGSWIGQFVTQMIEVGNEARAHGEQFSMSEFLPQFWASTFENWQSEWLQLTFQAAVLLALKHRLFKADAEDMEHLQADVNDIKDHLGIPRRDDEGNLEASGSTSTPSGGLPHLASP